MTPDEIKEQEAKKKAEQEKAEAIEKAKADAAAKKLADETKAKADAAAKKLADEEAKKEKPTDYQDYQKFAELKFLQWNGTTYESKNLNPESLKVFNDLEKRFKASKGKIPTIDKTLALGSDGKRCRIVKGYAVPKSLYDEYKANGQADKYFE